MKKIVLRQYRDIVDDAAQRAAPISIPAEGWLRTLRKALGMSGAQLARRMEGSRAQVAQAERHELSGSLTLKSLNTMAEAMGARVVYTLVPNTPGSRVEELLEEQAQSKAAALVRKAGAHMALENQALDSARERFELERLANELLQEMPRDFWESTE